MISLFPSRSNRVSDVEELHEAQRPQSDQRPRREGRKGTTTAHVQIDIGGGVLITSSITNQAVDDLAIEVGDEAYAVIKASDVMIGK